MKIRVINFSVPLKTNFKHHSADRTATETIVVEAARGDHKGYGESCPRTYVTGETISGATTWIESKRADFEKMQNLGDLEIWQRELRAQIDGNLAAFCAVELALLDLFGKEAGKTVETLLGIPEVSGPFGYSAVLSDESGEKLQQTLALYLKMGFTDFKFKLNGNLATDKEKLDRLIQLAAGRQVKIRLDANNLWPGRPHDAISYLTGLGQNFFGIEEPLAAHEWSGLSAISEALQIPIILDESLLTLENLKAATSLPGQWIPNIRISKVGGLQRALQIARFAREAKLSIIVGAQVGETSILTRAALSLVQAYRETVVAQEGAFGTLLIANDLVEPEIRFGAGGKLDWKNQGAGFGLHIREEQIAE